MEVLGLFKLRRNVCTNPSTAGGDIDIRNSSIRATTAADVCNQALETDDEASFFDLVFAEPDCDVKEYDNSSNLSKRDGKRDSNFNESPNDQKIYDKRKILPFDSNSKSPSPISLLRSPPKFRILTLGFKKSKSNKTEANGESVADQNHHNHKSPHQESQSKRFTAKFKVEEVPIVSPPFIRDHSLRSKLRKEIFEDAAGDESSSSKRFSKDVVQKYLNLIKPLYVRVSKRLSEKMRFSDHYSTASPSPSPSPSPATAPAERQGSRAVVFREACKHLVKSRSSSSAIRIMPSPASRRDDSVLQQQDGIQSAILHCKRSYSLSSQECNLLSRFGSNSSHEKSINPPRISEEEEKRSSI